ncbi:hypothetical protein CARUB_v10022444mg [Capsella rubella]|uniref:Secreted protein n=1 Tax=Capsella rubella TaxID=81985 RepID=R0GG78_9BRAS|nr:hypothetical protein CARUB_v10022444mg [Capsella rubella]
MHLPLLFICWTLLLLNPTSLTPSPTSSSFCASPQSLSLSYDGLQESNPRFDLGPPSSGSVRQSTRSVTKNRTSSIELVSSNTHAFRSHISLVLLSNQFDR